MWGHSVALRRLTVDLRLLLNRRPVVVDRHVVLSQVLLGVHQVLRLWVISDDNFRDYLHLLVIALFLEFPILAAVAELAADERGAEPAADFET